MQLRPITYDCDGQSLTGWLADGSGGKATPGVLVVHQGMGITDHTKEAAARLAEQGYVAFALDMYGSTATSVEQASGLMGALMGDAALLRRRARAGLDQLATVSAGPHAVLGFCFGGIVALEMLRDRAPLACAIACHPSFRKPEGSSGLPQGKVLMMIGDQDPLIPAEDRDTFRAEMDEAGADWQLHLFGGAGHSFTDAAVDALNYPGFRYDAKANGRAWAMTFAMLEESFG
ncbi:putative hydrolase [Sphingomonas changbaiensis NBRC 104936]|uniref:Putative hydrolase n=1 Tax=Sphingomonas changbaiensis NBRC 104936 TaxID=1219043 RepID=A0A0E9MMX4_9SPHN|nr:dienelactone hydrolase family protein [Sphingomonas changbaiensis]GAO39132.1 putative hydrolase [Sphingomonas changbaiensis NBRC 104936]